MHALQRSKPEDRLDALFQRIDVSRRPRVFLTRVGTEPTHALDGAGLIDLSERVRDQMADSARMAYLSARDPYWKAVGAGHYGIGHVVHVTFLVAGITHGCETEICCQRDRLHMSRVTVARTRVKSRPPMALPAGIGTALRDGIESARADMIGDIEAKNSLNPGCTQTAMLLTGSLKAFRDVTVKAKDPGKEDEFRDVLYQIREQLARLWPEFFGPVLVVDGLDGTGKSSLVRGLRIRFPDEIILDRGVPTLAVDDNSVGPRRGERYLFLRAPAETCLERIRGRDPGWRSDPYHAPDVMAHYAAAYDAVMERFQNMGPHPVIDARNSPELVAAQSVMHVVSWIKSRS